MQTIGFQEAVEKVCSSDARYQPEAYVFLRDALDSTLKRRKKAKKDMSAHVSAPELLDGFRLHALHEFGPMTITVLSYWGVRSSEDIGHMVFNLVETGVFGKTDEDNLENFRNGLDFEKVFVEPFKPTPIPLSKTPSSTVEKKA